MPSAGRDVIGGRLTALASARVLAVVLVRAAAGVLAVAAMAACASASTKNSETVAPVRALPDGPPEPTPAADGLPAAFHSAFADADARARAISYWMQCVSTVARLRASGSFGAAARAPRAYYCDRTADGVPVGGVYDIDSSYRAVRRLTVVRLDGARPRYTDALDTARIARAAKLVRDVNKLVAPAWAKKARPFSVVPVSIASSTEAWVIPRATKARSFVSGGDVGYAANDDGSPRVLVDHTATWTQLALPSAGPFIIYSSVVDVAAVADLATARYHTDLGRTVQVSTPVATSTLVPGLDSITGARVVWKHTARK